VQYIGIDAFTAVNWLRCVYFEERDEQIMIAPSAFFECEGLEKWCSRSTSFSKIVPLMGVVI
jgi:hypothetical protein